MTELESSILEGVAAPLPTENLDTDQLMPKQFLLGTDKSGLSRGLLHDLRFGPDGCLREDFVLNKAAYKGVSILVGGSNFGCGSSREHAVWGLQQYGIRAVLAPSFGEIFYYNAIGNRLLVIILPVDQIRQIMQEVARPETNHLCVDVERQKVATAGGLEFTFDMNTRQREMYLHKLDVVGATLRLLPRIEAFEQTHFAAQPWTRVS